MAKKFSKPELSRRINGDLPSEPMQQVETAKQRFDMLLLESYPSYSRSTIQKLIKEGYATIDDEVVKKPNFLLDQDFDGKVELNPPASESTGKPPVIYEDDNVIVFNKPIGMLSIKKGAYIAEPAIEDYGEVVHRLDRDTSGVIIVAKNLKTKSMLQRQFAERKTHKTYYAVVVGHPKQDHALIH